MSPQYDDYWQLFGDGPVDFGRFMLPRNISPNTGNYLRGTTDFADESDRYWASRHNLGKTCPGPGYGEPECGELIDNDAERCSSCRVLYEHYRDRGDPRDLIRERPTREVDALEYAARLRARTQAKKLAARARQKRGAP